MSQVRGGSRDGMDVVVPVGTHNGDRVAITEAGEVQPILSDVYDGEVYMVRGWGLELVEHGKETKS